MRRRAWLAALPAAWLSAASARGPAATPGSTTGTSAAPRPAVPEGAASPPLDPGVTRRALRFPADHGVHPETHVEWWYITGWMRAAAGGQGRDAASPPALAAGPPAFGFQVTFFRNRTGLGERSASRFAASQLVFAHAALTDLGTDGARPSLLHDQRLARAGFGRAELPAAAGEQTVSLGDWRLRRAATAANPDSPTALQVAVRSERFSLELALAATQPRLLQGDAGYSQKGPDPHAASLYYSEPQLALRGRVTRTDAGAGARTSALDVVGRAWLDHEWSDLYVPPEAMGWDWLGVNLADGGALMAFRLRRPDGSTLWAGGTLRNAAGATRVFRPDEVAFRPLRRWRSPRTHVEYPVEWELATPAGRWHVGALLDDQELDSRASTGAVYWEGIAALKDADGRAAGWGYLELTGYLERLRM
jgi:predicted secreted hydrolase